jgi:LysM repeat protein
MKIKWMWLVLFIGLTACSPQATVVVPIPTSLPVILTPYPTRTASQVSTPTIPNPGNIPTPTATPFVYTVKKDELGSEIALRYRVTLAMLQAANPGVDLNFLKEGSQLVIPAPAQTPSPDVFTPTPAAMEIGQPHCYPAAGNNAWCLVNIKNSLTQPVYYITGEFLFESQGKVTGKQVAALADILPPGQEIPVVAWMDGPIGYPYQVHFEIKTAFNAREPGVKSIRVEDQKIEIDPSGLFATITGNLIGPAGSVKQSAVIVSAYQDELPVGIRKVEFSQGLKENEQMPFEIQVYTSGPLINRVEVSAEGK